MTTTKINKRRVATALALAGVASLALSTGTMAQEMPATPKDTGLSNNKPLPATAVWIMWREGDRLIRWFSGENNLDLSSRNLSLSDDVVPTDADVGSSTYRVSRPWVEELEQLCEDHGRRVRAI